MAQIQLDCASCNDHACRSCKMRECCCSCWWTAILFSGRLYGQLGPALTAPTAAAVVVAAALVAAAAPLWQPGAQPQGMLLSAVNHTRLQQHVSQPLTSSQSHPVPQAPTAAAALQPVRQAEAVVPPPSPALCSFSYEPGSVLAGMLLWHLQLLSSYGRTCKAG